MKVYSGYTLRPLTLIVIGLHADKIKPEEIAPKAVELMNKKGWNVRSAAEQQDNARDLSKVD